MRADPKVRPLWLEDLERRVGRPAAYSVCAPRSRILEGRQYRVAVASIVLQVVTIDIVWRRLRWIGLAV
jgi:hypothetical protein